MLLNFNAFQILATKKQFNKRTDILNYKISLLYVDLVD